MRIRSTVAARSGAAGSLLAEVAMSAVMLMIAMALTVKVLGWVGAERRAWDRRQWAVQEAANLMERVDGPAVRARDADAARELSPLSPGPAVAAGRRAEGRRAARTTRPGGTGSKRVAIQLRWHDRSGEWDTPGASDVLDLSREARPMIDSDGCRSATASDLGAGESRSSR